jgi:hypothetical protein
MELAVLLYLASVAENLRGGFQFMAIIFMLVGILGCIIVFFTAINWVDKTYLGTSFEQLRQANRLARKMVIVSFFVWTGLMIIGHLVPTRKDVYVMAGGYVALKAANTEVMQTTASSVLQSIDKWLSNELAKAEKSKEVSQSKDTHKESK